MGFLRLRKPVLLRNRFKGMCMKPIFGWALAAAVSVLAAMPLTASAQHRSHGQRGWQGDIRHFDSHDRQHWRSGAWRHGWHGGRTGWWWVAGGSWYLYPKPVYPYPDPYRPPTIIVEQPAPPAVVYVPAPAPAPVQLQPQQPPIAEPPVQQFWYYCDAVQGYYPYVASCPGGWKTVPATPPGATQ